jgi:signal transduction histidine kinase/HPt (histidine-containing phosphotransfer) domain-containing protein
MKRLRLEIQFILLVASIAVAVIISGYLAWKSLSTIVDTIHKEARPDLKLLLIKDIASDLNEVENTIRLYSLTGNKSFLDPYRQLDIEIQKKLDSLAAFAVPGSAEIFQIDSVAQLTKQKLQILDEIRALYYQKPDAHNSFSKLYSRIDTAIIQSDTIRFKPAEKKSFFKRIFSKKDTTTRQPIVVDKTKDKENIKKEIAGVEKQITRQSRQLQTKEMVLLEKNIQVTQKLNQQIISLEDREQKHLESKTQEADALAAKTFRGMATYTIAAVILLLIILILFFRNLQKNRKYQQVLKKAKAEAESLTKAKELFVATVSHEMRTPVNAIYGLTEQMLQKRNSAELTSDLEVVNQSAKHLIALVNDTLDFSRIESQKMKIEQVDFLPDKILAEIKTLHKASAEKKGIELLVANHLEKDLVLQGDPIRLKQILINLITNAIKFTRQGQVTLTASGAEKPDRSYLMQIEVSDTGIGISKADLQLIFDEFVQLDTDLTSKHRGAGLGLSIVKKLILLHDGKIEVDSTPGKGTRFSIEIPYQKGNPTQLQIKSNEQLEIPAWFRKLHFLIVDDEEFNLYLIRNILDSWGVRYTEANNGKEAVKLAANFEYDLILMDIRMPVMDGYEASQHILQHRTSTRIIALTATTKSADIQKIELAGKIAQYPEDEEIRIDLNELERISGGDAVFFMEMLRIFIRSSEDALLKFQQNFRNSDWNTLAETAHKLAAPAKHIGANKLYSHLKQLEIISETPDINEISRLVAIVESEVKIINSILKQRLEA